MSRLSANTALAARMPASVVCDGKRQYETYRQAEFEVARSNRRHHNHLQPYRCPKCGAYHLGTRNGRRVRLEPKDLIDTGEDE